MNCPSRKILVAGMGTSPAVLTNAVWALAHQYVPVVPDEVIVPNRIRFTKYGV